MLDVLANDSDPDADRSASRRSRRPPVGEVRGDTGGGTGVEYDPPATGEPGTVSFSYSIADGRGGVATAQVVLELAPAPDPIPPEAVDDTVGPVRAGREIVFDPRLNDLDPDGSPRTLTVLPDDPSMTVLPDGRVEPDRTSRDPRGRVPRASTTKVWCRRRRSSPSSSRPTRRRRSRRCASRRRSARRSRSTSTPW